MKYGIIFLTLFFLLLSVNAYSQDNDKGKVDNPAGKEYGNRHFMNQKGLPPGPDIPGLSEEQKKAIHTLITGHLKDVMKIQNKIVILEAELRTLTTADEVNMAEINKKIDEIGLLRSQLMKEKEANRQEIRKLLTPDQRVTFDLRPHH